MSDPSHHQQQQPSYPRPPSGTGGAGGTGTGGGGPGHHHNHQMKQHSGSGGGGGGGGDNAYTGGGPPNFRRSGGVQGRAGGSPRSGSGGGPSHYYRGGGTGDDRLQQNHEPPPPPPFGGGMAPPTRTWSHGRRAGGATPPNMRGGPPPDGGGRTGGGGSIFGYKTRLCVAYSKGSCANQNCKFAHGEHELRKLPDFRKTKLCHVFANKGKCPQIDCSYAHGEEELQAAPVFPGVHLGGPPRGGRNAGGSGGLGGASSSTGNNSGNHPRRPNDDGWKSSDGGAGGNRLGGTGRRGNSNMRRTNSRESLPPGQGSHPRGGVVAPNGPVDRTISESPKDSGAGGASAAANATGYYQQYAPPPQQSMTPGPDGSAAIDPAAMWRRNQFVDIRAWHSPFMPTLDPAGFAAAAAAGGGVMSPESFAAVAAAAAASGSSAGAFAPPPPPPLPVQVATCTEGQPLRIEELSQLMASPGVNAEGANADTAGSTNATPYIAYGVSMAGAAAEGSLVPGHVVNEAGSGGSANATTETGNTATTAAYHPAMTPGSGHQMPPPWMAGPTMLPHMDPYMAAAAAYGMYGTNPATGEFMPVLASPGEGSPPQYFQPPWVPAATTTAELLTPGGNGVKFPSAGTPPPHQPMFTSDVNKAAMQLFKSLRSQQQGHCTRPGPRSMDTHSLTPNKVADTTGAPPAGKEGAKPPAAASDVAAVVGTSL